MLVDRHATAIIKNLQRAISVERDIDTLTVPCNGLIDAIVDNLVRQMIRPRRIRIHTRTPANRIEPAQDLNICSVVIFTHSTGYSVKVIFVRSASRESVERGVPAHFNRS